MIKLQKFIKICCTVHLIFFGLVGATKDSMSTSIPSQVVENGRVLTTFSSSVSQFAAMGNVHSLTPDDRILRGALPIQNISVLVQNRVTDVLSLQPETHPQFKEEKQLLNQAGYLESQIHNMGFEWDKQSSFEGQCTNYLKTLKLLKEVKEDRKRRLYFHCTVGEDRTGLVAALYRVVFEKWSFEQAVSDELCAHGYAFANLDKPQKVSRSIQKNLGRHFLKMIEYAETQQITFAKLDPALCVKEPALPLSKMKSRMKSLECLKKRHRPS